MKQALVGLLILALIIVLIWINMDPSDTDPSGEGSGKVKLMTSGAEVTLQADGFQSAKSVHLTGSRPEQDVEAGNYRINKVVLKRDSDNSTWMMETRDRTGTGKNVEVNPTPFDGTNECATTRQDGTSGTGDYRGRRRVVPALCEKRRQSITGAEGEYRG